MRKLMMAGGVPSVEGGDSSYSLLTRIVSPGTTWTDPLGGLVQDTGDALSSWPDLRYASEWSIAGELEITTAAGTTVTPFQLRAATQRYVRIYSQNWSNSIGFQVADDWGDPPGIVLANARNQVVKFALTKTAANILTLHVGGSLIGTDTAPNPTPGYPITNGELVVTDATVDWQFFAIDDNAWSDADAATISADPSGVL